MKAPAPFTVANYNKFAQKDYSDKIALIDADFLKYTVTSRVFKDLEEGLRNEKKLIEKHIENCLDECFFTNFRAKAYVFCFSAPSSKVFRSFIAQEKEYKGNRKNRVDPDDYEGKYKDMIYVIDYIEKKYTALLYNDVEADDLLSMLQVPKETFIYSKDKDLKQVEGHHYNIDSRQLEYTTSEQGLYMLMDQLLVGDTVDNIPGLKGFGVKALERFKELTGNLSQEETLFLIMQEYTKKHGILEGVDMFIEMWNLLSMRLNRGAFVKEKYQSAFTLIEALIGKHDDNVS